MRKAIVQDNTGEVLNVIEINDFDLKLPEGQSLIDATNSGSPGDTWDGSKFITPEQPEPELSDFDKLKKRVEDLEKISDTLEKQT